MSPIDTLIENPPLYIALSKLDYPLADYNQFAISWPYTADHIRSVHELVHMLVTKPAPISL